MLNTGRPFIDMRKSILLSPAFDAGLIRFTFPILKVRPWSLPPHTVVPHGTAVDGRCRSNTRIFLGILMTTELFLKDVQEISVGIAKFSVVSVSNLGLLLPTFSALVPLVEVNQAIKA